MYERDPAWRNDTRDTSGDPGADPRSGRAPDYDDSAPRYDSAARGHDDELATGGKDLWSQEGAADTYPEEDEGASPGYARPGGSPRWANRFRDDPAADFDDPSPTPPSRIRTVWFILLMAAIGSTAGVLWFYYDPEVPGFSNSKTNSTTELLISVVNGQGKLTQSVTATQAAQDALQKNIAAREQELQRLLAETEALRADMNALRSGLAGMALRSHGGQAAKSVPAAAKKAKAESKPPPPQEQPQNGSAPMGLSPAQ